jgi:putative ABC transport system substrate-binding protein
MMRRREFITLLGGAAAAWPRAARAQQGAMPVVGFLSGASAWEYAPYVAAFRLGLADAGYAEGGNVQVEYRWADGHYERFPTYAAELIRRQVAVIVAFWPSTPVVKAATTTIPIVFVTGNDPVEAGLVASLNRPGGNLTGAVTLTNELAPKKVELLHEVVPAATSIALLVNPANPNSEVDTRKSQEAARIVGLQLHVVNASSERDFDAAFASVLQLNVGGLVVGSDVFFNSRSELLATLALRHRVPTIYQYREFAAAGGLMSYGGSIKDSFRVAGVYAGRILKGEKPADLPVQQITKVELIINLKTAKALGLTVPITLLGRADEVIE